MLIDSELPNDMEPLNSRTELHQSSYWDLAKIKFKPANCDESKIVAVIDFSLLFAGIGIEMLTESELEITVNTFRRDIFDSTEKTKPISERIFQVKMMIPHDQVNSWL